MKKKILIIGNGAKEYALAKKLSKQHDIYIAPQTNIFKEFATGLDIREDSINELLDFAVNNDIDMTIPVSKVSIDNDIASLFTANNQPIFAPNAISHEIVANKAYAKKMLYKLHIPTPKFGIFEKENMAQDYIKNQSIPFVIKTNESNSAVVLTSAQMAKNFISRTFIDKTKKIIIEDYIYGTPFSFYAVTDGYKALPIGSTLTYKHSLEGDGGQLTSGMGACSPNYKISIEDEYYLMDEVIYPALESMERSGNTYLGIIGVNGIINDEHKFSILGWHSFMQDCDADAILENLEEDLYNLFNSCILGSFSDEVIEIKQKEQYSVSLVLNCVNKETNENTIKGIENLDENTLVSFFPTVTKNKYLEYESNYGPNIVLTSQAGTVSKASEKVYAEAKEISYNGISYRKDIANQNLFA